MAICSTPGLSPIDLHFVHQCFLLQSVGEAFMEREDQPQSASPELAPLFQTLPVSWAGLASSVLIPEQTLIDPASILLTQAEGP